MLAAFIRRKSARFDSWDRLHFRKAIDLKIVVAPADSTGCGYVRMIVPYMALRGKGYDVTFVHDPRDKAIFEADVLVLQRQTSPDVLQLMRYLKSKGTKIVFEFDDNFHCLPPSNPNHVHYSNGKPATKTMESFIREADVVTVSTPGLKDEYAKFNPNIHVCYNSVDDAQFARFADRELTGFPKRDGEIRIGWAGSDTHRADFGMVLKQTCKVLESIPWAKMVFIGADMRSMLPAHLRGRAEYAGATWGRHQFKKGDEERADLGPIAYFDLVDQADLDVAIAPIESTTFNRCKSYIKVLEYGMLGIPALASNFGPYRQYAHNGPILIADPEGWENRLRMLCINQNERLAYARHNREAVGMLHLISQRIGEWESALAPILETVAA